MDDPDLAADLLDLFARQAERIMGELGATGASLPPARRRRADLLHTLIGSARAVGAWDVAAGAERLEREDPQDPSAAGDASAAGLDALDRSVASALDAIAMLRRAGERGT